MSVDCFLGSLSCFSVCHGGFVFVKTVVMFTVGPINTYDVPN